MKITKAFRSRSVLAALSVFVATGAGLADDFDTRSTWRRLTNDPAHFASQPGGAVALHVQMSPPGYRPGDYVIYHGITDDSGVLSYIDAVQRMEVTLAPDTRYLGVLTAGGGLEITPVGDEALQAPGPGHARIYVRNEDPDHYRGICVLPAGNAVVEFISRCGDQGY